MNATLKIEINGQTLELSKEQAEELMDVLEHFVQRPITIPFPPPQKEYVPMPYPAPVPPQVYEPYVWPRPGEIVYCQAR